MVSASNNKTPSNRQTAPLRGLRAHAFASLYAVDLLSYFFVLISWEVPLRQCLYEHRLVDALPLL